MVSARLVIISNGCILLLTRLAKPETQKTLPLALMKCISNPFLAAIIPRLFLIIFRYSQPILIKESIRYVGAYPAGSESSRGYWLVVSAVGIYVGLAVRTNSRALSPTTNEQLQLSTAVYGNCINRLELVTRSTLVGLIHHKTINSPSISYDDGEATTLMSTDADSLIDIGGMIHETWAQVVEVLIGVGLLAGQVGWIWPLPILLIYCMLFLEAL